MDAPHILVVDDDLDIQIALRARLQANGYEVSFADTGTKGVDAAASIVPDLILLDIRLPEEDGFEVLARLKQNPALAMIPVVMLSAQDPVSAERQAMAGGATAYCRKPFVSHELMDTIASALERVGS